MLDAFGLEESDDGVDGIKGGGMERRVSSEGFAGIDTHDFKTQDLFFELEGEFCVGWSVEWVFMEEGFRFVR